MVGHSELSVGLRQEAIAMTDSQLELSMPPKRTNDVLSERLADLVERFNATTDPAERVDLHREIKKLRAILFAPRSHTGPEAGGRAP